MRSHFSLFQSHLDLTKEYWQKLIHPGDTVIDATCGNGKDAAFLASLPCAKLYALDKQAQAITKAKEYCQHRLSIENFQKVHFIEGCHSLFPDEILPSTIKLVVYNLGYLPGGDKTMTTHHSTTLISIEKALKLLIPGGALSITCYPGHSEGKIEQDHLAAFAAKLSPLEWNCCHHVWLNREAAPSLLLIQRYL